jgi:hypothetical protein
MTEKEKIKYTCPCGFSSYDLMEFLRHPFMEYSGRQDEVISEKPNKESQSVDLSDVDTKDSKQT